MRERWRLDFAWASYIRFHIARQTMKTIKKHIEENFKIVVVSILMIILIIECIRYWFYADMHLKWDQENAVMFNNIASPIATIISGILLVATILIATKQNRIALSESSKSHIEKEFERIAGIFKENVPLAIGDKEPLFNSYEATFRIYLMLIQLRSNEDYKKDLLKYSESGMKDSEYTKATYFKVSFQLSDVLDEMEIRFNLLKVLVESIEDSHLLKEHVRFYKRRVKNEFLNDYIEHIGLLKREKNPYKIPHTKGIVKIGDPLITFIDINETQYIKFIDYINSRLNT